MDKYNLRHMTLTHECEHEIREVFEGFNKILIDTLISYMKLSGNSMVVNESYDPQSGWYGQSVIIDNVDLSGNGYCLTERRIAEFLGDREGD